MNILALVLLAIGLLISTATAPVALFGIGPFLLGASYLVYIHGKVIELEKRK